MKKALIVWLSLITLLFVVSKYIKNKENISYYQFEINEEGNYEIVEFDAENYKSDTLILPSVYKFKKITSISSQVFNGLEKINKIIISRYIKEIAYNFNYCVQIKDIWLKGESLLKITSSFNNCINLERIHFTKLCNLKDIDGCFNYCYSLQEVNIPRNIKILDGFNHCYTLSSVKFSNQKTLKYIGGFRHSYILKRIDLPKSLLVIKPDTFRNSGLKEIVIPKNVVEIAPNCFKDCIYIEEIKFLNISKTIMMHISTYENIKKFNLPTNIEIYTEDRWNGVLLY